MCPHLILTRQYRESCEFLRGGTQAVETANVFYPTKTFGTIGQIFPFRRECCLLGGGGSHPERLSQVSRACFLTKPFKVQSFNFIT